jgi:epoxyqueuosine reductase
MSSALSDYTLKFKKKILGLGADLVGVANVMPLRQLEQNPPELLDSFRRAVSIAIALPKAVFEHIKDHPTPIYASVYQTANRLLDEMAFQAAQILQGDGFSSLPVPASQVLDRKNWYGAISHKAVGRMAGLGWQGKSLLLINSEHGPRIRLATVLTEAALNVDGPIDNRCGDCMLCTEACPVGAIKGAGTHDHYKDRAEALHLSKCADLLTKKFSGLPNVGAPICGICIRACPFGH